MDAPQMNIERDFLSNYTISELLAPLKELQSVDDHAKLIKIYKFATIYPLARLNTVPILVQGRHEKTHNELPDLVPGNPLPNFVWRGSLGRWIASIVNRKVSKKSIRFCWNWQNAKKGCLTVPNEFVSQAKLNHAKDMSTPHPEPFAKGPLLPKMEKGDISIFVPSVISDMDSFKEHVRPCMDRIIRLIFPGTFMEDEWLRPYESSTSASFEKKRSEGGQRAEVKEILFVELQKKGLELPDAEYISHLAGEYGVLTTDIPIKEDESVKFLDRLNREWYGQDEKPLSASIATVCEPLKVRTLSKGPSLPYWRARALQKYLWYHLQKLNVFNLIGCPATEAQVSSLLSRDSVFVNWEKYGNSEIHQFSSSVEPELEPEEFRFWVSGDYSAATDKLWKKISKWILESILHREGVLDKELYNAYMKVLLPHRLYYTIPNEEADLFRSELGDRIISEAKSESGKSIIFEIFQQNGQLMGSNLSFVVLCLANFFTWLFSQMSIEKINQLRWKDLNCLPVLINGDDILFRTDHSGYDRWQRWASFFGFNLSPGKNLVSHRFCTVNTTMFDTKNGRVERVPYGNVGLLTRQSKVNGSVDDTVPVWDIHNQIVDEFHNRNLFTKLFLTYWREDIQYVTSKGKFNLYLPLHLGGCGFRGEPKAYTPTQLAVATYLYQKHKEPSTWRPENLGLANSNRGQKRSLVLKSSKEELHWSIPAFEPCARGIEEVVEDCLHSQVLSGEISKPTLYRRYPIKPDVFIKDVLGPEVLCRLSDFKRVRFSPSVTSDQSGPQQAEVL
jgi:hypothetical protein